MKIHKLEKLDQYSQLTSPQAPVGYQAPESKPLYFGDQAALDAHLVSLSCDPKSGLDNGSFRSYKSHTGTYIVSELDVIVSASKPASDESKAE
jgi:hypothetical protein